jgi:hypothetical protein
MQESNLFEYAVIRVVPKVEREEFLNVGIVLFCAGKKFLQTRYKVDEERLRAFDGKTDIEEIKSYLKALEEICAGKPLGGAIGMLPIAERFRWLTATRSTVVQTSKVHPGFCGYPDKMLERLFEEMVL